jgi:hypothetical protein
VCYCSFLLALTLKVEAVHSSETSTRLHCITSQIMVPFMRGLLPNRFIGLPNAYYALMFILLGYIDFININISKTGTKEGHM